MAISCCLIGEDSLLIQCGNILLAKNHDIRFVLSPIKTIQDWSKKHGIPYAASIDELFSFDYYAFDYIFSIVSSRILSNEMTRRAREGIIYFHDSILSKYEGLNSTTWAILNNEREHGITWRIVHDELGKGEIVKQQVFPIDEKDTAFTLNLRCYEEAVQSFSTMIDDIEQGSLLLKKRLLQNDNNDVLNRLLPNFGFIDWNKFTAEYIIRISRSLTLGHHNNLGVLKIALHKHYIIIQHVELSPIDFAASLPGTVLAIKDQALFISTLSGAIKINSFTSSTGLNLTVDDVVQQHKITVGLQFTAMQISSLQDLENLYSSALKSEEFWIDQLKDITEHAAFSSKCINNNLAFQQLEPVISVQGLLAGKDIQTKKNILLAAILIYLYRLNDYEKTSVSILYKDYGVILDQYHNLFSCFVPFIVDWRADDNLGQNLDYVAKQLVTIEEQNTFLTDLTARHSLLLGNSLTSGILINMTGELADITLPNNAILYFQFDAIKDEISIHHRLDLNYHGGIFQSILLNLTEHIANILGYLLNKPQSLVNNFCFLTQTEQDILLKNWGKGEDRELFGNSIYDLFENQVALHPDKIALSMGEDLLSYHQLWKLSEVVASAIRTLNLPFQTLIGIYVHRSIHMFALILGVLKADCVYVPIDTKYPLLKIEAIFNAAKLEHVLTSNLLLDKLSPHFDGKDGLKFHTIESILENQATVGQGTRQQSSDSSQKLAYVMFTSGTTGAPKGVMVTQKNIINYCQWFIETTKFDENATIDFSSSFAFDLSVPCTIAPLLVGGQIAMCDEHEKTNPQRYLQHLKNNKVTHTELTPGYLEMLLNYPDAIKQLVDLRYLLLGADVVPTSGVLKWLSLCPHHQIINEYGPTETTVSATSYFVNKDAISQDVSVPIGRPAFNTTCYLLDKYANLCPIGIKGELYIAGWQVTNGYLGKPQLTQEKFSVSHFDDQHETMYKTGDLTCWLPDGNLQFFGRNDHQVKIQGYRIELTGIEAVLVKIPTIYQAVVVVKKGFSKEKYLRAYLVSDAKDLSSIEIKTFLAQHLPIYMVPKELCITHAIPLKENEKIDFEALEKQPCHFLTFDHAIDEELNEFEKITMRIWQHAFNNTAITSHDDFFDIGGDSLLALQIITELKNHYKIDIPLYYLFEYPTITLLSEKISELTSESHPLKHHAPTIIKLATGNYGIPLFLIHPVGGSVFWYKQLAKYLDGKYTIYGIQDISIDGDDRRFDSLEAMASYYLQEISSVYSGDRYCLGGASFGSTVAFEMAQQLLRSNKKIEFLGLFDGWAEYPEDLMKENTIDLLSKSEEGRQSIGDKERDHLSKLEEYRKSLLRNYKLPVLNINATLYKARELWTYFSQVDDSSNGWKPYIEGELIIHYVPGNHETMFFDPNVRVLAEYIKL